MATGVPWYLAAKEARAVTHLTLLVLCQVSFVTAATDGGAVRHYREAYQQTTQTGQPLLVLVGADWCVACQRMKVSILPELHRRRSLRRVTFVTVDKDSQQKLAAKLMKGGTVPQLVLFTKIGDRWTRRQLTGAHSVAQVQLFLDRAMETAAKPATAAVR
ncbi:MAG: hypothetical protein A2W31_11045 [Planctomycetes bacterium RBG_16_64_10]|nr:MAG: hypothetical protein A2W31_11045 [Planctomycetes bacterium RBG_16_64_10]